MFDRERRAILGYALRRTNRPEDAADVVAETFLVAWRRLDDVPQERSRAWLYGVARKVLANQRRGERRHRALTERLTSAIESECHTLFPDRSSELDHSSALRALGALGPSDREILKLAAWEELEPAEIAVALEMKSVTARSRLHRARKRFKAALAATKAEPETAEPATKRRAAEPGIAGPFTPRAEKSAP